MIRLDLPIPPSANELFLNNIGRGYGRRIAPKYAAWRWQAFLALRNGLKSAPVGKIEGRYKLTIYLPERMRGDCDNRIKAVSDFLVDRNITHDDRYCADVRALRASIVEARRCVVEIESLDPVQAVAGARGPEASASGPFQKTMCK